MVKWFGEYMQHELFKHKIAYLILVLGLVSAIVAFMGVWPNAWLQRIVILMLALFYFAWGVVMHKRMGNLSSKVIQEYAVVALFASGMLLIITF